MQRRLLLPLGVTAVALTAASPALAATPPSERRIPANVTAGGIPVGGLLVREAAAKLKAEATPRLAAKVVVRSIGHRYPFDPVRRAKLKLDADRSAARAFRAGAARGASTAPVDAPLAVTFSRAAVDRYTRSLDRRISRGARSARVKIGIRKMQRVRSRPGRELNARALATQIAGLLPQPAAAREIRPKLTRLSPKVTADDLAKRHPTIVTIDRGSFKLRLFKGLKLSKTYRVAVGAEGYDTPSGTYRISNKAVNPTWSAPNRPWAGIYAGSQVPGGSPLNPLKARWLGIANGVGIHGTDAAYSIGTRASHGCIRMTVPDVVDLYPRVPMGSPVLIR